MPSRRRKKQKRYEEMTNEDWGDWGERMRKGGKEFGERFERRMERKMEHKGRERRTHWSHWWLEAFGVAGPIVASIIGIVFLAIGIFVLRFVNFFLGSTFLSALAIFLYANIGLFFVIFLFSSYNEYFHRRHWRHYWIVEPIAVAISITIAFWILSSFLYLVNTVPKVGTLIAIADFLSSNLMTIFVAVVVVGYVFVFIRRMIFHLMRP